MRASSSSGATSVFPAAISLFFVTASVADLMRLADHGRIKEGNVADLVVCDGDALADIKRAACKENHRLVVKRGIVARDNRAAFAHQGCPRRGRSRRQEKAIPESFVEEIFFILVGIAWALGTPLIAIMALVRTSGLRAQNDRLASDLASLRRELCGGGPAIAPPALQAASTELHLA